MYFLDANLFGRIPVRFPSAVSTYTILVHNELHDEAEKKMLAIPGELLNYLQGNGIYYTERIDIKHDYSRAEFPFSRFMLDENLISSICAIYAEYMCKIEQSDHLFATSTSHWFLTSRHTNPTSGSSRPVPFGSSLNISAAVEKTPL